MPDFPRNITNVCSHPVTGQESRQHPEAENRRKPFIPLNTSFIIIDLLRNHTLHM